MDQVLYEVYEQRKKWIKQLQIYNLNSTARVFVYKVREMYDGYEQRNNPNPTRHQTLTARLTEKKTVKKT